MIRELWGACRPMAGVFAALLAIISFRYDAAPWSLALLTAFSYACLTWNIMVFNDYVDRVHDRKKGKCFASENSKALRWFWATLSGVTAVSLGLVAQQSMAVAVFCMVVWTIGVLYSYVPHWYVIQNLIVAACSASPVLAGNMYSQDLSLKAVALSLAIFFIVLIREIYKDIEDVVIDKGYKKTLPVVIGVPATVLRLLPLTVAWFGCLLAYPNVWVRAVAIMIVPTLWIHARLLADVEQINAAKAVTDWLLRIMFIIVLVTQ